MVNPYEASTANPSTGTRRRAVRRYLVPSSVLFVTAPIAYPGLELLNQKLQLIPTQAGMFDVEINGELESIETATLYTVGPGLALLFVAFVLCRKSFLNWRHNRAIRSHAA